MDWPTCRRTGPGRWIALIGWAAGAGLLAQAAAGGAPAPAPAPAAATAAESPAAPAPAAADGAVVAFARTPFARWGAETLAQIEKDLRLPGRNLYAEYTTPDGKRGGDYGDASFVWPAGFQLRALAAAAAVDPAAYRGALIRFADALDAYWKVRDGAGGYMVLPGDSERFYDDNAWIVLGLVETFHVTREPRFLKRAAETLAFVAGSERKTPGGGLRQQEDKPGRTSVCTTAPAAVGALRLYRATRDPRFLAMARRWYDWLTSKEVGVQGADDGLFDDQAGYADGTWTIVRGKRAYNSALPMQAAVLLYQVEGDARHLAEARRMAASALGRWFEPSGALRETGQWGGSDLADALLDLYLVDRDPRWLEAVRRMLDYLHTRGRDPAGRYGEDWHVDRTGKPLAKIHLLYMAPAARAYWRAAGVAATISPSGPSGGP